MVHLLYRRSSYGQLIITTEHTAESLTPVYIRALPRLDGWGQPIMFWSDGKHYLLVSPGKDQELERDWAEDSDAGVATTSFASDIVFADGSFVQWPEGKQQ